MRRAFVNKNNAIHCAEWLSNHLPDTSILVYYCPKTRFYIVDEKSITIKPYEQLILNLYNGKDITLRNK